MTSKQKLDCGNVNPVPHNVLLVSDSNVSVIEINNELSITFY